MWDSTFVLHGVLVSTGWICVLGSFASCVVEVTARKYLTRGDMPGGG